MFFQDISRHYTPHIHAVYGGASAVFAIEDSALLDGSLPPAQMRRVRKWLKKHRAELREKWEFAVAGKTAGIGGEEQ